MHPLLTLIPFSLFRFVFFIPFYCFYFTFCFYDIKRKRKNIKYLKMVFTRKYKWNQFMIFIVKRTPQICAEVSTPYYYQRCRCLVGSFDLRVTIITLCVDYWIQMCLRHAFHCSKGGCDHIDVCVFFILFTIFFFFFSFFPSSMKFNTR